MNGSTDCEILQHLVYTVFLPPELPQKQQDESFQNSVDLAIIRSVIETGREYSSKTTDVSQWRRVESMLERFYESLETPINKSQLCDDITRMKAEDSMTLYIRAQNAGLIIRRQLSDTTFETFEVQAQTGDVMSRPGKIVRHFPGPAVQLPNSIARDSDFIKEAANILARMDVDVFDEARPKTCKGGNEVDETRDSINPNYFIQYFFGFLRGMGTSINPPRIVKRIGDEVLWKDALNPWRRSPIWLIARVAIQTSLQSTAGYKHFMTYYHADIISRCYKNGQFSSDLLYAMRVKMARRLYKLKDTAPHFLLEAVKAATYGTQHVLQGRWDSIQAAQAQSPKKDFSDVNFKVAINHELPHSRNYLEQIMQGRTSQNCSSKFTPDHSPRLENVTQFSKYADDGLSSAFTSDPHVALFDFEASVFDKIANWTSNVIHPDDITKACRIMSSCFHQYLQAAQSYYTADAADQSIMLLTLMLIWMAIDEIATEGCSLLRTFSPEIPYHILDPLLLRTAQHIEQARVIQEHIRRRHDNASSNNPSIFSDEATDKCFAVQYYRYSPFHEELKGIKQQIEAGAENQKKLKRQELAEKNAKYDQLSAGIQQMSHTYTYTDGWENHNKWSCGRCSKNRERSSLKIKPYEYPLPTDRLQAEAVVFELERPEYFTIWRDITYQILVDLGSPSPREECTQYVTIEGYGALGSWLSTPSTPRITIASATKSLAQSHYEEVTIPTTEDKVCLSNPLQFLLYDRNGVAWATGPFLDATFAKFGTFKLPSSSLYNHLEYTLGTTAHTSNQVIADQYDCPPDLSLNEHIAFGTLRSGARLQWMNIVRGLEEDLLTFSSDEVWLLHTQAAWQLGILSDDGSREWHEELSYVEFGSLLISQCTRVLKRVEANWLQAKSILTIVTLVNRLTATLPSEDVATAAYATCEDDVIGYQRRVCEMAAINRATYDVEPKYLGRLLSSPDDLVPLIEASIRLHDNQPPKAKDSPISLQILLSRDHRFAHKFARYMLTSFSPGEDILSRPLSRVWSGDLQKFTGWQSLPTPNNRWIIPTSIEPQDHSMQEIHLNLLSGQLLINGKPIGRLPRQYVRHATYIRLFGQKILDVAPMNMRGMEFAVAHKINGYQVSFALNKNSNQLIIQAEKFKRLYELVPHGVLCRDFPSFLSEDYHHWADVRNNTIEFRPISDPWSARNYQWILDCADPEATTLENAQGTSFLLDIHSLAFKSLTRSLSPLESDRYLHVTRSLKGHVDIELPRMKISFFINDDAQIESRNFRGQVLDDDQSAGALFGLKNQLVLRAKGAVARTLPQSRSVLIPDGEISFATHGHHVSVSIRLEASRTVDVYRYKIDKDLGYLATDAGLTSRLYKTYLHALTSHCLPDPLTGRTGTEESLHELSQGSTSSFEQINVKQAGLLKAIGLLTPRREYYPKHLQCMQTTQWSNLPSLSQHFAFSSAARLVLDRADTLQIFHKLDFELGEYLTALETSDTLLERAARRTVLYYSPDLVGCTPRIFTSLSTPDTVFPGRDDLTGDWEEEGQAARWASGLAHQNWGAPVFHSFDLVGLAESWGTLHDSGKFTNLSYRPSWFSVNLRTSWINIYDLLRQAGTSSNPFILSSFLASIAFRKTSPEERSLIPVFLAFATNPVFQDLDPPSPKRYKFIDGYEPSPRRVEELVSKAEVPMLVSPAAEISRRVGESPSELHRRRVNHYDSNLPKHRAQFVRDLMNQWPRTSQKLSIRIHSSDPNHSKWFDADSCLQSTTEYFSSCLWNIKMRDHLRELEGVLSSGSISSLTNFARIHQRSVDPPVASRVFHYPWNTLSLLHLMHSRLAPYPTEIILLPKFSIAGRTKVPTDTSRLSGLFTELQQSKCPLKQKYASDLEKSRAELEANPRLSFPQQLSPTTVEALEQMRERCKRNLASSFSHLHARFSPQTDAECIIFTAGVWPRITSRSILQQLSLRNRTQIDFLPKWKNELLGYAQVFADYQKSQRLVALVYFKNIEEFYKELDLANDECDSGSDDPDCILVQIDGNFGARTVQRRVAREMIAPSTKSNTVLQLNMGEGKSSVIVPIIASSLADSSHLVRVLVLKPLWRQMFELLVNRLSGLANRRIYYLPFQRKMDIDASGLQKLKTLYEECMREGGIPLAQPEHILSFKLMGIESLISKGLDDATANTLRSTQSWLETHTRDILDESDEILHVRYQLVYTIGEQAPPDDHPDRWTIMQQLLRLAAPHIERLQKVHRNSLAYKQTNGGRFPGLRIMSDCPDEVEKELISAIAADVLNGRLLKLSCDRLPPSVRANLVELFTNKGLSFEKYESLRDVCDATTWKGLLLIRGLLAYGILIFALKQKYYRVDYGLDLKHSRLAVPFRAKDIPSLRAEFGHSDVVILLTCLSYYYEGLTDQQLETCFKLLFKLDNRAQEYEKWVQQNELTPEKIKQLNGVNPEDRQQFIELLIPAFAHNSATIDFFLSSVVFPKEAKEFPQKLSTSSWDLSERKTNVTTGFSGTNDNRYLLPASIAQDDPVKQLSTNALVLTYLLQPENNHYICMCNNDGTNFTTVAFLKLIAQSPEVRVLLDVGAQMLELQNEELVRCWLDLRPDVEAAVYFNDRDELVVLPQNGTPVLLSTSSFAQQLDKCIVYLDDGHTRGTDLKLPRKTRALVTLGPKVTKDRLLQGCMRMRKLGHGQSVIFAAPPEIDTQIRNVSPNPIKPGARIDALDVLRWAMLETCKDLRHHVSHWAQQGIEYSRRHGAEREFENTREISVLKSNWTASEARSLEELYGVPSPEELCDKVNFTQKAFNVPELRRALEVLGVTELGDPSMDEEQEREIQKEAEVQEQVEGPPKRQAVAPSIHPEVKLFINTGNITARSGIVPLFHTFHDSSPQITNCWSPLLFASTDFLQTVEDSHTDCLSEHMRPVNWIVSSGKNRVVLSPHEVNELLPQIRKSIKVRLHVYAPRVSFSMRSFSDLQFYSFPSLSKFNADSAMLSEAQLHLDLFAGQLHLSGYDDYVSLCLSLGLFISSGSKDNLLIPVDSDGFVRPEHRDHLIKRFPGYSNCRFESSPISALKDLIGRRRKGISYLLTDIGRILHGRSLTREYFNKTGL